MISVNCKELATNARCASLGLSLLQAQALADAEPFPSSVFNVLGLDPETLTVLPPKRWMSMAAETSSTSYKKRLTPEILLQVLVNGHVPDEFRAHIITFIEEAPMKIVIHSIEQAAQQSGVQIGKIWGNVLKIGGTRLTQALAVIR